MPKEPKDCKDNQVYNTVSKRCVSREGRLGKKILRDAQKKSSEKKKSPKISPKKTIEGLIGGVIFAFIVALIFLAAVGELVYLAWWSILGLILILAFFALLGDLFESMIKRMAQVKDTSDILPGHGGVLDRIDSYTAAVAPLVFILSLVGYVYL